MSRPDADGLLTPLVGGFSEDEAGGSLGEEPEVAADGISGIGADGPPEPDAVAGGTAADTGGSLADNPEADVDEVSRPDADGLLTPLVEGFSEDEAGGSLGEELEADGDGTPAVGPSGPLTPLMGGISEDEEAGSLGEEPEPVADEISGIGADGPLEPDAMAGGAAADAGGSLGEEPDADGLLTPLMGGTSEDEDAGSLGEEPGADGDGTAVVGADGLLTPLVVGAFEDEGAGSEGAASIGSVELGVGVPGGVGKGLLSGSGMPAYTTDVPEGADRPNAPATMPANAPGNTPAVAPEPAGVVQVARLEWRSAGWIAGGLFVAFVLVGLVRNIPDSLTRVGVGILFAFALDPVVVRLRHRLGCSRAGAVAIVSVAVGALFALLVFILGPPAVEQAQRFGRELPETVESSYDFPVVGNWLEERDAADEVRDWAADLPARVDTDSVTEVAKSVLDGVLAALMVMVVGLAVLVDGDRLVARMQAALPASIEPAAIRVGRTFYRTMGAYFAGSLLVASLAAIFILAVGLAFQVPLAPAAALWMLVVNLIPQIGGFLGGGFFTLLAMTQGLETGLICLVLYLIYMNFENHIIQPTIVGQAVDLSPPATMLAALVGGAAAGIPGALVATPLAGATKSLYMELRWGRAPRPHKALGRLLHH